MDPPSDAADDAKKKKNPRQQDSSKGDEMQPPPPPPPPPPPQQTQQQEWVLLLPPPFTKATYPLLCRLGCVRRTWHLDGQYGPRIHRHHIGDGPADGPPRVGIPVASDELLHQKASTDPELERLLLQTPGVELVLKDYTPSNRMHLPPPFDASVHPERQPNDWKKDERIRGGAKKLPNDNTNNSSGGPPPPPSFAYAELFAGIGGFGVALDALGGRCVFCSELDEHCRTVYRSNFPSTGNHNVHGDIYEVKDDQLPQPGTLDLLVGGFPCQPFSAMGEQPGLACDSRRGTLFLEIVRVLRISQPTVFLLENVPGLLQMSDELETITEAFREVGYLVAFEVVNARGLTASARKRAYFVGFRKDPINTAVDTAAAFEFPFMPDLGLRGCDVLCYDDAAPENNSEMLRITDAQLDRLVEGKHWKPVSMAWPNKVCSTLVSHYGVSIGRGTSQLVPCRDGNPRRFSARECARIMGFPEAYVLPTDKFRVDQGDVAFLKEQYRMLGNAVCPPVVAALAGAVLSHCPNIPGYARHGDWVVWGRDVSIELAYQATRRDVP